MENINAEPSRVFEKAVDFRAKIKSVIISQKNFICGNLWIKKFSGQITLWKKEKMKTILILVGKTTDKHFQAGISDYAERISHYMPFEIITIPELKNTKSLSEQQQKTMEGELIMKQLQPSDTVVLLDEHGKEMRSMEYASWLQRTANNARRLVFIIGGPYGFSPSVYERANDKISLSRMTFSHQMVRLIFTEQLYRACTIIKNEPYHHE